MSVELHLPDLPEVSVSLGPADGARRLRRPWPLRLREALSSYLPMLLLALLALGTWWLVQNTPRPAAPAAEQSPRHVPDYTMSRFSVQRFAADGRLAALIEGDRLRHFPDVDRLEIDLVRIRAWAPDGRLLVATAKRALANGDATEVQLLGGAEVTGTLPGGQKVVMRSEFLHAFIPTERVRSHLPVVVQRDGTEVRAAGFEYDNLARVLKLRGPQRTTMMPRAGGRTP